MLTKLIIFLAKFVMPKTMKGLWQFRDRGTTGNPKAKAWGRINLPGRKLFCVTMALSFWHAVTDFVSTALILIAYVSSSKYLHFFYGLMNCILLYVIHSISDICIHPSTSMPMFHDHVKVITRTKYQALYDISSVWWFQSYETWTHVDGRSPPTFRSKVLPQFCRSKIS
jgi:hypothetical protein